MASYNDSVAAVERRRNRDATLERHPHLRHLRSAGSRIFRSAGLGLITGAADDDPSAIGTYARAGAMFGPSILWVVPLAFPMMFTVVFLSSKIGQVAGEGLAAVIRSHYPRRVLYLVMVALVVGNTIQAGADIGGVAAALKLLLPVPTAWIVIPATLAIISLQVWGSYTLIRNIFRWLTLALFGYIGSAILTKPDPWTIIRGTFLPSIHFNTAFLTMLVAVIGSCISPYLYVWQAAHEVEEDIAMGRRRLGDRRGTTREELRHVALDIGLGMFFSSFVIYFVILATASALSGTGKTDINTAAEAAEALRPLAGNAAGLLFAIGIVGVGFLAVPVMTTGAAYVLCETFGWKHGLHAKPAEARKFYCAIAACTTGAMAIALLGLNPIKALFWAAIVQGMLAPPLMVLIMLITNNRAIMGRWVNGRLLNFLGWTTIAAVSAAALGLLVTLLH